MAGRGPEPTALLEVELPLESAWRLAHSASRPATATVSGSVPG